MQDQKFFSNSLNSTMHNGHKFIFRISLVVCVCVFPNVNSKKIHKNTTYFVFPLRFRFYFLDASFLNEWIEGRTKDNNNKSYYYGDSGLAMVFVGRFYTKSQSHNVSWNTIYDIFFTFVLSVERWIYGKTSNHRHSGEDLHIFESSSFSFREWNTVWWLYWW